MAVKVMNKAQVPSSIFLRGSLSHIILSADSDRSCLLVGDVHRDVDMAGVRGSQRKQSADNIGTTGSSELHGLPTRGLRDARK